MKFLKAILLMFFVLVPQSMLFASIISYKIEKVLPTHPTVGENIYIFIKIDEDTKLRSIEKQYRYQDTDSIEFGEIKRTILNNNVYLQVELRAKHSGDVVIPSISEDNYTFLLPVVSIKSTLDPQTSYVPVLIGLPLGSILHVCIAIVVLLVSLCIVVQLLYRGIQLLSSLQYTVRNQLSYSSSIKEINRLIRVLNDIGGRRVRIVYKTRDLYAKIINLFRQRITFYRGKSLATSMTNTELASFFLEELNLHGDTLGKKIQDMFKFINQIEYGMAICPLEIRKKHCQLVLTIFSMLKVPQEKFVQAKATVVLS